MKNNEAVGKALVLVRTPFQAWLVEKVVRSEGIKLFDVIYFTQNNSGEDREYYSRLERLADKAEYIFIKKTRPSILAQFLFRFYCHKWFSCSGYHKVLMGSIDSYVINALAFSFPGAKFITFDDGSANINSGGIYNKERGGVRSRVYRFLLRAKNLEETKAKIARHYSVFPSLPNIVEKDRVVPVSGWQGGRFEGEGEPVSYFVGAPFKEVFSEKQIQSFARAAKSIGVDVYVRHPREYAPLDLGVPFLNKSGEIAEEAILSDANGRSIVLVGYLSTLMFTLSSSACRRVVLVPQGIKENLGLISLAQDSGCELVFLGDGNVK